MGYDATTMGNHDFDAGIAGFAQQLPFAKFPGADGQLWLYRVLLLEGKTQPYKIFRKGQA